jgi:four helix bundle protein
MNESIIKKKSFAFAVRIVRLHQYLTKEKKEFALSKQVIRSGTSIGANVRESQNAESKADFVHKLGIAQKETDETLYWLELLFATDYIEENLFQSLNDDAEEILKIVRSIIITSKKNLSNK